MNKTMLPTSPDLSIRKTVALELKKDGYLVVEPELFEWHPGAAATLPATVCRPQNWSGSLNALPLIIDLSACDDLQLMWLAAVLREWEEARSSLPLIPPLISAHVGSDVSLDHLVAHIDQRLVVLPVDSGRTQTGVPTLWRFFDPRLFGHLCWMLDEGERSAMTGPINKWQFPWFGGWFRYLPGSPKRSGLDTDEPKAAGHRMVDLAMWKRTERIPSINELLMTVDLPKDADFAVIAQWARVAERALHDAKSVWSWPEKEDQMAYATMYLRHGRVLHDHPKLRDSWTRRRSGKETGDWFGFARGMPNDLRRELDALPRPACDDLQRFLETSARR